MVFTAIDAQIYKDRRTFQVAGPVLKMIDFLARVHTPDCDKTNRVMTGLAEDMRQGLIELVTNKEVSCPTIAPPEYQTNDGRSFIWLPEKFIDSLSDGSTDPAQQLAALIYSASITRNLVHGGLTLESNEDAQERSDSFLKIVEKHPDLNLISETIAASKL